MSHLYKVVRSLIWRRCIASLTVSLIGISSTATLQYEKWKTEDGKLILWGKSVGNGQAIDFSDTLNVAKISADSMLLEKYGMYRITYYKVKNVADVKPFEVLDSLAKEEGTVVLQTRVYKGSLPVESCVEIRSELTIYNYTHSGDGVYKLSQTYLRGDGQTAVSNSYGRLYTLRGDAQDRDAVVYELVPFHSGQTTSFLYQGDKLIQLDSKYQRPKNLEANTLSLQK